MRLRTVSDLLHRTSSVRLLVLLAMAILIRVVLFAAFPLLLTNDSVDYLSISQGISEHLSFSTPVLGDWRLPAYPVFLSLARLVSPFDSDSVVVIQKTIGFCGVLLGLTIGYLCRSRLLAEAMVLFLGLNPVYLLNEHLVMTESFFLFSLLAFSVIGLICLRGTFNLSKGILFGSAFGVSILTRANGLFFCAPIVAGVALIRFIELRSDVLSTDRIFRFLRFVGGILAGFALIFGPWLWRNYVTFGRIQPFTHNRNINLVVFLSKHDLLDPSLPRFAELKDIYDPEDPWTVFSVAWHLREDIVQGNALAGSVVAEQLANQPLGYVRETLRSLVHLWGYPAIGGWGRDDLSWLFRNMVGDIQRAHRANTSTGWYTDADSGYIAAYDDTWVSQLWSRVGTLYFWPFRSALFSVYTLFLVVYLVRHNGVKLDVPHVSILLFSSAYFLNSAISGMFLADLDRLAAPFDWSLVLVMALICSRWWGRHDAKTIGALSG